MVRWLRIGAGMGLILIGLFFGIVPGVPGVLFGIPGLIILSREFHWAKRILQWFERRFPQKSARD